MSYENSISELEEIVEKLSDESVGLEESIILYSNGIDLAKTAMKNLGEFKGKIELLNKDLSALEAETENDDDE